MGEKDKESFDPKVETLYQSCLKFLHDFGRIPSGESRQQFSSIYVQYYICLKDDHNLPLADEYIDLDEEFIEGLDAVQFVYALANYYHKKLNKKELLPYR